MVELVGSLLQFSNIPELGYILSPKPISGVSLSSGISGQVSLLFGTCVHPASSRSLHLGSLGFRSQDFKELYLFFFASARALRVFMFCIGCRVLGLSCAGYPLVYGFHERRGELTLKGHCK